MLARATGALLATAAAAFLFVTWSRRLDEFVTLPVGWSPLGGTILMLAGATMMLAAARPWFVRPGPSENLRTPSHDHGPYRYLRYPLHAGAVLAGAGLAFTLRSPAALWISTPLLAVIAAACALGYPPPCLVNRTEQRPLLSLPDDDDSPPRAWNMVAAHALLFLPWLILYMSVEFIGVPPDAVIGWHRWEYQVPVLPWTEPVYMLAYPFIMAVPFIAATRADLRRFMVRGWIATALIIPLYLLVPIIAPAKPVSGDGLLQTLMRWEREYDSPATAFPAFHVVWMLLAAQVYARRWKRLTPLWWVIAAAVSISCVTVGMHASIDVIGGIAAFFAILRLDRYGQQVHAAALHSRRSQKPSKKPHRTSSDTLYAGVCALITLLAVAALSRREQFWVIAGAVCVVASVVETAARMTSVVRGPARPATLYSAAWMLLVTAVLARLWLLGAGLQFIVAIYLVGTGVVRFVVPRYEREVEPHVIRRLPFPRSLGISALLLGLALAASGWTPAPSPGLAGSAPEDNDSPQQTNRLTVSVALPDSK